MESKKETVYIPINLEYDNQEDREYILHQLARWKTAMVGGGYSYRKVENKLDEIILSETWQQKIEQHEAMKSALEKLQVEMQTELNFLGNNPIDNSKRSLVQNYKNKIDNALNQQP